MQQAFGALQWELDITEILKAYQAIRFRLEHKGLAVIICTIFFLENCDFSLRNTDQIVQP